MMYWIIKEGHEDKKFIEERTKGFEDLKKTVEKYADATKRSTVSHSRRSRILPASMQMQRTRSSSTVSVSPN